MPGFADSVDLRLRPSTRALMAIFVIHAIAIGLLPFALPPGAPLIGLVAAFAGSWFWLRRHSALGCGPRAVTRLIWHADGSWSLFVGEREGKAELLPSSLIQPWLLVLNFRAASGRRYARVIAGGEADPEVLRRLRARLSLAG